MTSTTVAHPPDLDERTLVRELIRSIPNQTATAQLPNPAGTPPHLHGPTPASNAPEGARLVGAARTTDKADVLAPLLVKPRI